MDDQKVNEEPEEGGGEEEIAIYNDDARVRVARGEDLDLAQKDPTLKKALIGVGWDLRRLEGEPLDLDVSVFLLDKDDKTRVDEDFVFYNNLEGSEGAVKHLGDNRTGAGDGDDENVLIDINGISFDVVKIAFVISIYPKSDLEEENFSMVRNVFFRLVNEESGHEIFRYELDDQLGEETALMIGVLERIGPKWIFRAMGEAIPGGLSDLATEYGIIVAEKVQA